MVKEHVFFECFNGLRIDEMYSLIDELSDLKWNIYIYYKFDLSKDLYINGRSNIHQLHSKDEHYFEILESAKYIFVNTNLLEEPDLNLNEKQKLIQLWHGVPFKYIGHDVKYSIQTETKFNQILDHELSMTNYLLIPNEFCKEVFKKAFVINDEVELIDCGYTRNDYFFKNKFTYTKEDLGKHKNKTIVCYTPTWNDKDVWSTFKFIKNFDNMIEQTKDTHFYILSFHPGTINLFNFSPKTDNWMINENNMMCNIDLFNISDVLVTDFSSIMFDYALTNKPVINFFTKKYYSEYVENRGSYFDMYEEEFNIANSVDELLKMLKSVDKLNLNIQRFAPQSGYSAKKIIEKIGIKNSNCEVLINKVYLHKKNLEFKNKNYIKNEQLLKAKIKLKRFLLKVRGKKW